MLGSPLSKFFQLALNPVEYGTNDCCTIVADCVREYYGFDPLGRFRGRYKTKMGFARVLRREGCKNLLEGMDLALSDNGFAETDKTQDYNIGISTVRFGDQFYSVPLFYYLDDWHGVTPQGIIMLKEVKKQWQK